MALDPRWRLRVPDRWDLYEADGAPVIPPVRNGVAAAVHGRKEKADKSAEKRSATGRRITIRKPRV